MHAPTRFSAHDLMLQPFLWEEEMPFETDLIGFFVYILIF